MLNEQNIWGMHPDWKMGLNPTRKLVLYKVRLLQFLKVPWLRPGFG